MEGLRKAPARGGCAGRRRNNSQLLPTKEGQITGPKCQSEGYQSLSVRGKDFWLRYKRSEAIPGWVSCRRQKGVAVLKAASQSSFPQQPPTQTPLQPPPFRNLPLLTSHLSAFSYSIVLRSRLRTASFFCAELSANCLLLPLSDTLCPLPFLSFGRLALRSTVLHFDLTVCSLRFLPCCPHTLHNILYI